MIDGRIRIVAIRPTDTVLQASSAAIVSKQGAERVHDDGNSWIIQSTALYGTACMLLNQFGKTFITLNLLPLRQESKK